jgi:hypothetical protein
MLAAIESVFSLVQREADYGLQAISVVQKKNKPVHEGIL